MEALNNINFQFYLAAFLIGGIPFGALLSYLFAGVDVRRHGSGSIGATNVLRVLKDKNPVLAKRLSIATMVLDALKGAAVILVGMVVGVAPETLWAIAVFSVVGHCFSPYLMFEGGKGVATTFGVMGVMMPVAALIGAVAWFIVGKYSKISSLASLAGIFVMSAVSLLVYTDVPDIGTHAPIFLIVFFVVYKHLPNIFRLITNQERSVV